MGLRAKAASSYERLGPIKKTVNDKRTHASCDSDKPIDKMINGTESNTKYSKPQLPTLRL